MSSAIDEDRWAGRLGKPPQTEGFYGQRPTDKLNMLETDGNLQKSRGEVSLLGLQNLLN